MSGGKRRITIHLVPQESSPESDDALGPTGVDLRTAAEHSGYTVRADDNSTPTGACSEDDCFETTPEDQLLASEIESIASPALDHIAGSAVSAADAYKLAGKLVREATREVAETALLEAEIAGDGLLIAAFQGLKGIKCDAAALLHTEFDTMMQNRTAWYVAVVVYVLENLGG